MARNKITLPKGDVFVPGTAYLDGRDTSVSPPLTIMQINVFDLVGAGTRRVLKAVATVPHGTRVDLLKITRFKSKRYVKLAVDVERRRFFGLVKRRKRVEGWVTDAFICRNLHPPVGERLFNAR